MLGRNTGPVEGSPLGRTIVLLIDLVLWSSVATYCGKKYKPGYTCLIKNIMTKKRVSIIVENMIV